MYFYNENNYTPNLFDEKNDIYMSFLKKNMCHYEINKTYETLKRLNTVRFDDIVDHCIGLRKRNVHRKSEIMKNVLSCNKLQYDLLSREDFKIYYNSTMERNCIRRSSQLKNNIDFKTRTIVLYFRGPWRVFDNTATIDIFRFETLYRTICRMIENRNFKLFNNVQIVFSDPITESYEVFEDGKHNLFKKMGDDFVSRTCLYSNTVHFTGGELPDLKSNTIPIISTYLSDINTETSKGFTEYEKINVMFPEMKIEIDKSITYGPDIECSIHGKRCSWMNLMTSPTFLKAYSLTRGFDFIEFVDEVIESIHRTEDRMIQ